MASDSERDEIRERKRRLEDELAAMRSKHASMQEEMDHRGLTMDLGGGDEGDRKPTLPKIGEMMEQTQPKDGLVSALKPTTTPSGRPVDPGRLSQFLAEVDEIRSKTITREPSILEPATEPGVEIDGDTNLDSAFVFDDLELGEDNSFIISAAQAVAKAPGTTYNPMIIYGGPGSGKTHLLNAIGNMIRSRQPDLKVRFESVEDYDAQLQVAVDTQSLPDLQEDMNELDVLLLDNIHLLDGRKRTQQELFYSLKHLTDKGKQIVIASDCPPEDIEHLESRLHTYLQSGLITDLAVPDLSGRVKVAKRYLLRFGLEFSNEVLTFMAKQSSNMRQMHVMIDKLVDYHERTKEEPTVASVRSLLHLGGKKVREPTIEGADTQPISPELLFMPGRSYLYEEVDDTNQVFGHFSILAQDSNGLCITRENPKTIRMLFQLGENVETLWLSTVEGEGMVSPQDMEILNHHIKEFCVTKENAVILLDGIEYLTTHNSFKAVLKMVQVLRDYISVNSSIFIISASPGAFDPKDLKLLQRELHVVR